MFRNLSYEKGQTLSIVVLVSEHVILSEDRVFAETATTVFESPPHSPRQMLDLGNRVRRYRAIQLSAWGAYDKCTDLLPNAYLEAAM